jgi:hypothetical protein
MVKERRVAAARLRLLLLLLGGDRRAERRVGRASERVEVEEEEEEATARARLELLRWAVRERSMGVGRALAGSCGPGKGQRAVWRGGGRDRVRKGCRCSRLAHPAGGFLQRPVRSLESKLLAWPAQSSTAPVMIRPQHLKVTPLSSGSRHTHTHTRHREKRGSGRDDGLSRARRRTDPEGNGSRPPATPRAFYEWPSCPYLVLSTALTSERRPHR